MRTLPRLWQIPWERFYALSNFRARKIILIIGKWYVTRHYVAKLASRLLNQKIQTLKLEEVPIACRIVRTGRTASHQYY